MRYHLFAMCLALASVGCDTYPDKSFRPFAASNPIAPTSVPIPGPGPAVPPGPLTGPGAAIASGEIIHATVGTHDPGCFPNWDASAYCRRFKLETGDGGVLRASLKWSAPSGADLMDLFAMAPDGTWVGSWDGKSEELVIVPVGAGLTYDVLVMSYSSSSLDFELMAEVQK